MKRILHISKYYPPQMGGIEDVCYNIVSYLSTINEVEQKVICFNTISKTVYEKYQGVEIIRVASDMKILSQPLSIKYKKELENLLQNFRPDIVHFHAPNPFVCLFLNMLLSRETTLIIHWHSDIVAQKNVYKIIKPIETGILKRADTIIATSPNYILYSEPLLKFKNKIHIIPNTIDISKFEYSDDIKLKVREIKERYMNKPIVFFIGRHVPYKGLKYLLEAIPFISVDCEFIIGGDGPLTDKLKKMISLDNLHFIGRIPDDLLAAYYYAADIFVFPSITKNEAFGVVLAEAMYCYTPSITFTIKGSGVNWVNLANVTGLEVENSNSYEFSQAIDKLLKDNSLRSVYALNARKRVEELFVFEDIKSDLRKLYSL
ncbi:MAG: D-inositol-3-phosphate glycosyltransferase [Parabacteroides sp.]